MHIILLEKEGMSYNSDTKKRESCFLWPLLLRKECILHNQLCFDSWAFHVGAGHSFEVSRPVNNKKENTCIWLREIINHFGNYLHLKSATYGAPWHSFSEFPGTSTATSQLQAATSQGSKLKISSSASLSWSYSRKMTILIGNWFFTNDKGLLPRALFVSNNVIWAPSFFFLHLWPEYSFLRDPRSVFVSFPPWKGIRCKHEKQLTHILNLYKYFI